MLYRQHHILTDISSFYGCNLCIVKFEQIFVEWVFYQMDKRATHPIVGFIENRIEL